MSEPAGEVLNRCPVCDSQILVWRNKTTTLGIFPIHICISCGFAFVNPRPTSGFLNQFYANSGHTLDGTYTEQSLATVLAEETSSPNSTIDARNMLDDIVSLIPCSKPEDAKLLDVGCGYGFYSREALNRGFLVTAIELAAIERQIAASLLGFPPLDTSFENFSCAPGDFSVIVMSQILEHALDVDHWLQRSRDLLRDDGLLAIAVPNFGSIFRRLRQENEAFIIPPAHLNYFNGNNLALLLKKHGFHVQSVRSVSRIRRNRLWQRMPPVAKPLAGFAENFLNFVFRSIDVAGLGMMVHILATKQR